MQGKVLAIARRARPRQPMEALDAATVTVEGGVAGDIRGTLRDRQVTVLAKESWDAACEDLGRELPWTTRRANILVEGLALAETVGATIHIGEMQLSVTDETDPCQVMEQQATGLKDALTPNWRGGVTCRVVHGGDIRVGDVAELRR